MPHHEGSERLAALRGAIARIETRPGLPKRRLSHHRPFQEPEPREAPVRLGHGGLRLDAMLGGGLRRKTLHEIVAAHRQDDGAAAGFAAALALRAAGKGPLVWILEDCVASETGSPYRPGFAGHGFGSDRLILVRTQDEAMTLWALEEALRLKAPVVLAELWGKRRYGLAPSRRLLLAARAGGGMALLLHTGLSGQASALSSAAETRFCVASCPSPHLSSAGGRMPIPGPAAFAVRLVKRRLGSGQGFDTDLVHRLVWNAKQRCFDDHPVSFGSPAPVADRPAQAAGERIRRITSFA